MSEAFTYDELDAVLRGTGQYGFIGMSAVDGLIAALVAAPSFVHPDEWVPLIFAGKRPELAESGIELRVVRTIFNRYNEVSTELSERPGAYRPIFITDEDGGVVARDWAAGFMLGVSLRSKAWAATIMLTEHRRLIAPILACYDLADGAPPDMPVGERRERRGTAYRDIAQSVVAIQAICNPRRATEARREARPRRKSRRSPPTPAAPQSSSRNPTVAKHRLPFSSSSSGSS